ncbi:MAG TPA: CAP domain-containing protein [Burkholderiaceae bacterium]
MNDNNKPDMPAQRRLHLLWAFAAAATLVSGCGGGGSSDASGNNNGSPSPSPAPATPVLSTCGLSNFSTQLLQRINTLRAAGANCGSSGTFAATGALTWNGQLTQAADGHSQDMAAANFFSHTGSNGSAFDQRISATGYKWSTAGENIAAGYSSVDAVMDGWISSPGHCANLMNPNFSEVGVSCVPGSSTTTYSSYWTMDLAKPQ